MRVQGGESRERRRPRRIARLARGLFVASVGLGVSPSLMGQGGLVTDQAVSLFYGPSHWDGTPEAALGGVEPSATGDIAATGWFYRLEGVDTREHPFPAPTSESYSDNHIYASWTNVDGKGFDATEDTYVYDQEGPSGAFASILTIHNTGASTITVRVFHCLNGDMLNTPDGDTGLALAPKYLRFAEGNSILLYSWRGAEHYLVRPGGGTGVASILNDSNADDFDDSGLPITGDWTAGFQGVLTASPGSYWSTYPVVVSVNLPAAHSKGRYWKTGNAFPELALRQPGSNLQLNVVMRRSQGQELIYPFNGYEAVALNDFDHDYFDEWVTRDSTGRVIIGGTQITGATGPPPNWKLASTEDFSSDFKADLLWRNVTSQKLVIWTMNGINKTGNIVPSPDQAVDANWDLVGTADFNHDSFPDFLWYNQTSGNVVIWYMNQMVQRITGGFTNPASVGNNNWKAVAVGDFGKGTGGVWDAPDIVWQNDTSHKLVIWYMDHAGNRTSGVFTSPDNFSPYDLVIGPR